MIIVQKRTNKRAPIRLFPSLNPQFPGNRSRPRRAHPPKTPEICDPIVTYRFCHSPKIRDKGVSSQGLKDNKCIRV
ncbi:hypothetical protein ABKN59_011297 [Abortiporus biennis]